MVALQELPFEVVSDAAGDKGSWAGGAFQNARPTISDSSDSESDHAGGVCRARGQYPFHFQAVMGTVYGCLSNGIDRRRPSELNIHRWCTTLRCKCCFLYPCDHSLVDFDLPPQPIALRKSCRGLFTPVADRRRPGDMAHA